MNFGERLKFERQKIGYTQQKLADFCEVSILTQKNYEKGKYAPGADYLRVAAKAGLDVDALFRDENEVIPNITKFDIGVVRAAVELLCMWLKNNKLELPPHKMADGVLTLCELGNTAEEVKQKAPQVLQMLRLVA